MNAKNLERFRREVDACTGDLSRGTKYADGGQDFDHGLWQNGDPCSCGHRSHYVSAEGEVFPSVMDAPDTAT